jgi:hypothetical protein
MTPCKTLVSDRDRIPVSEEFIKRNNLRLLSEDDIARFLDNRDDIFGFEAGVLTMFLPWEKIKHLYKEDFVKQVDAGTEDFPPPITSIEEAAQDFLDYMVFAWDKAESQRGISASRSISKLFAWLSVMGRKDLADILNKNELYNPYGAPALIAVCDAMGIKVPKSLKKFAEHPC